MNPVDYLANPARRRYRYKRVVPEKLSKWSNFAQQGGNSYKFTTEDDHIYTIDPIWSAEVFVQALPPRWMLRVIPKVPEGIDDLAYETFRVVEEGGRSQALVTPAGDQLYYEYRIPVPDVAQYSSPEDAVLAAEVHAQRWGVR